MVIIIRHIELIAMTYLFHLEERSDTNSVLQFVREDTCHTYIVFLCTKVHLIEHFEFEYRMELYIQQKRVVGSINHFQPFSSAPWTL